MKLSKWLGLALACAAFVSVHPAGATAWLPGIKAPPPPPAQAAGPGYAPLKPITAQMLKFTYATFDGSTTLPCTHKLQNADSQDWTVSCSDRKFLVHLWVTEYTHPTAPRLSTEVLYWVTDLTDPNNARGTSTTVWFNVNDPTTLSSIDVTESVDDDLAGLDLTLSAN